MTEIAIADDDTRTLPPFLERFLAHWLRGWTFGRLTLFLPRGHRLSFGANEGPEAVVSIKNLRALWRLAVSGSVGWAEGYMAGEWESPDLTTFLTVAARNIDVLEKNGADGTWAARLYHRFLHVLRSNTRAGSRDNIAAHYDLGNEFYGLWLDPSMTYSSAIFDSRSDTLAAAQQRKYHRLCESLNLKSSDHVLEIGCGWGGFAEVAAQDYGCRVTALTLSERQAAFTRARMNRLGLASQVEVRLQDYRDVSDRFTAIASIEMFEAVGTENWETYFDTLQRRLAPGGRAAIQTITIADDRFETYSLGADFIQRYIFPGGVLPSPSRFRQVALAAGFEVEDQYFFGADYAETLRRWADAFNKEWPAIARLGFEARFRRMWNYYLGYCEAGFRANHIDVAQFVLVKDPASARQ